MRDLLTRAKGLLAPSKIQLVMADTVQPEVNLMFALPPKTWTDSESFGQLGLGSITKHVSAPARLHDLEGPKVARLLSCGQYNTAAYVERSRMGPYTWGPNYSGQLGHNYLRLGPITRPTRLDQFKTTAFAQIRLGYNHVLGLTERGDLYVWGSNMHGQLGLGDTKDRTKPSRLTLPGGGRVRSIAAGAFSSFASRSFSIRLR